MRPLNDLIRDEHALALRLLTDPAPGLPSGSLNWGPSCPVPALPTYPAPWHKPVVPIPAHDPEAPWSGDVWVANARGASPVPVCGMTYYTETDFGWATRPDARLERHHSVQLLANEPGVRSSGEPDYPCRWRSSYAPDGHTSIPGGRIRAAIINNAHLQDTLRLRDEIERVCVDHATVTLLGYQTISVAPDIDGVVAELNACTASFRTAGERHLNEGWANFPVHWESRRGLEGGWWQVCAEVEWTRDQAAAYILSWPKVRRACQLPLGYMRPASLVKEIFALWGPRRKKRLVRLPVTYRTGRLT